MNINDLSNYGKKVWRPAVMKNIVPVFNVINLQNKKYFKQEYELKVNNIGLCDIPNFISLESELQDKNFSDSNIYKKNKNSFYHFSHQSSIQLQFSDIENIKKKNQLDPAKKNVTEIDYNSCSLQIEQNSFKSMKIIKKEKNTSKKRKVYLKWAKYSSTDHKNITINENKQNKITRNEYLLKKYWNFWKIFSTKKKLQKTVFVTPKNLELCPNQRQIINRGNSEDNLLCKNPVSKSKSRFIKRNSENDMRKIVIESQKQKIEEQAKLIRELQLIRLKLENEKFENETQELLEENNLKVNQKSKVKLNAVDSSSTRTTNTPTPPTSAKYKADWEFVTRMEIRANERRKRWDLIKERKEEREKEKLEKMELLEIKKKNLEDEEKKRRLLQVKEEKQRQLELRKRQEEERLHLNNLSIIAIEHYHMKLLKSCFNFFKLILKQRKLMWKQAEKYNDEKILQKYFFTWKLYYKIQLNTKLEIAEDTYTRNLLIKYFNHFKLMHTSSIQKNQVAENFYHHNLLTNYFHAWRIYLYKQKHNLVMKENAAIEFYNMKLMKHAFDSWKNLSEILFHEREKEQRIRVWCNKVQEFLPDFEPSSENCTLPDNQLNKMIKIK